MNLHLYKKRIIYTICFMLLNAVDFVRNTQNGDAWSVAVNATGLIMLVIIASGWHLSKLFTPGKIVWTMACIGISVYALLSIRTTGMDVFMGMYVWTFVLAVANVWWMAIFLVDLGIRLWQKKTMAIHLGKLGVLWIVMTALMMCSRSGRVWPIWFLLMFGMFYLTEYGEEDRQALGDGLIDGTILSFFALQIFAYGFRPYDVVRYTGAFANSNMAALHYLIVYAAILMKLHLLHRKGARWWWKLFYFTGACGMLGFMFLTMGRTSWGIAIVLTIVYGILVMHQNWQQNWQQKWRQIVLRGAALGLGAVLLFPAVFGTVRWLPTILHYPIWFLDEYSINKVHSFDPADSWKYVELDEFLETVLGRIWGTFQSSARDPLTLMAEAAEAQGQESGNAVEVAKAQDQESGNVAEAQDQESVNGEGAAETDTTGSQEQELELSGSEGMDASLNIRLSIYKAYLQDLNLLGHTQSEGLYQFADMDYHAWHAQNLWLEVAYRYGIPAGILCIVLTVWLLIYHARKLKQSGDVTRAVIPLLICLVFFGYGTMELVWNTGQYILTLFFIVQHPMFYQKKPENKYE